MRTWPIAALVFVLAAGVHARSVGFGVLDFDDPRFILSPEVVRAPSLHGVGDVLVKPVWGSYHPLHILSYSVDSLVFGMERPWGFHLTNVLLFACCAALVVHVARSYGCTLRGAALVGAFFAVHPSHVESVAWLTGRKDVLSGFFLLLAVLSRERVKLAFVFFVLALASKTTAAVFAPFLLLEARLSRTSHWKAVPFLVVAAVWLAIEVAAQQTVGGVKPLHEGTVLGQVGIVLKSLAWYPVRFFFPHDLSPHPTLGGSVLVALCVLSVAAVLSVVNARHARAVGFFFLALAPVCNVLPLANAVQDRYLYLPSIAAACVVGEALARRRWHVIVAALFAAFLARETWRYELTWQSDEVLWRHAIAVEPEAAFPHVALAAELAQLKRFDEAAREAEEAVDRGGGPIAWTTLARIELARGKRRRAEAVLRQGWFESSDPSLAVAFVRLAAEDPHGMDAIGSGSVARVIRDLQFLGRETSLHRVRAFVAQAEHDLPRAEREYLLAESELDVDDWVTLAAIERTLGRDDMAQLAVRRALALDSSLRVRFATDTLLGPLFR
jgi:hypothetical protein